MQKANKHMFKGAPDEPNDEMDDIEDAPELAPKRPKGRPPTRFFPSYAHGRAAGRLTIGQVKNRAARELLFKVHARTQSEEDCCVIVHHCLLNLCIFRIFAHS